MDDEEFNQEAVRNNSKKTDDRIKEHHIVEVLYNSAVVFLKT
jgi:hypothetical protein